MRILFVAMADSVHAVRWIRQLAGTGWDLHLYPSTEWAPVHPEFRDVTVHKGIVGSRKGADPSVRLRGLRTYSHWSEVALRLALRRLAPNHEMRGLVSTIRKVRPDVIHSLEIQAAGYLTLSAREAIGGSFPPWLVTNWGSDIYLFGRLEAHRQRIRSVLASCDYYSCECERDVRLAREHGFAGEVLPVIPNSGGYDLDRVARFRTPGPTSARRVVLIKGYQTWAGRALVALRAVELAADALRNYRILIYVAGTEVRTAGELLRESTGLQIEFIDRCSHDDMLQNFGRARMAIGISISDAISTLVLESMVMGAFPIQSCTSCASEWITDGSTGLLVPPEDPEAIARAIRTAASDDALVDRAAEINARVARERLAADAVSAVAVEMYERIRGARPE